ncbi:hypothetical protein PI124_g21670 [Phytophthora idaei]|nr:hypothetical protein PI125_g8195 [Phytophthora idaei]KAG3146183.1 hypothetical protein PI126_g13432 [Phytophthora idaei]KAG3233251.1 hypothetical protein PI124_g21670 [Phytophthora idaei]
MSAASATTSPLGEPHAEPEYVIPSPPPTEYPIAEAAEAAIHEWTLANRYNVTRKKQTRNDNGDVRYVLFACDHAGGPKNTRKLSSIPLLFRDDMYSGVVKIITVHVLKETHKLWKAARKIVAHQLERSHCDGVFRRTHGRPCIHDLIAIIESNGLKILEPTHFEKHWWLPVQPSVVSVRVLGPAPLQKRRRLPEQPRPHSTGYGINSTRREPSGFELAGQDELTSAPTTRTLSFQELLEQNEEDFEHAFLPPRSWGYAGLRELQD